MERQRDRIGNDGPLVTVAGDAPTENAEAKTSKGSKNSVERGPNLLSPPPPGRRQGPMVSNDSGAANPLGIGHQSSKRPHYIVDGDAHGDDDHRDDTRRKVGELGEETISGDPYACPTNIMSSFSSHHSVDQHRSKKETVKEKEAVDGGSSRCRLRGSYLSYLDETATTPKAVTLEDPLGNNTNSGSSGSRIGTEATASITTPPPPFEPPQPFPSSRGGALATQILSLHSNQRPPGAYSFENGRATLRPRGFVNFSSLLTNILGRRPGPEEQQPAAELHQHSSNNDDNNSVVTEAFPGNDGLAEAMAVDDTNLPNMEALPYDIKAAARKRELRDAFDRKQKNLLVAAVCVLFCIGLGVILGIVFHSHHNKEGVSSQTFAAPSSSSPSESPSSVPSAALDWLIDEGLSEESRTSLEVFDSPQWNAMEWLSGHPDLLQMTEQEMMQLFALATFYHSMHGNSWPQLIRDGWLQYDKHECYWFSSSFGLVDDGGNYVPATESSNFNNTPCSKDGDFQFLMLNFLQLSSKAAGAYKPPFVAPEISLLPALNHLALPSNEVNTTLSDFLPPNLYVEMPNLAVLALHDNHFSGSLSTELGLVTSLGSLTLYVNALTGPIQTELGLLSSMQYLALSVNSLTGRIPSELGVTDMVYFSSFSNLLTGPIPSELGTMTSTSLFSLAGNSLTGHIPSELGMMKKLTLLHLQGNHLTGPIPSQLGLTTDLEELSLWHNSLTGQLPSELSLLTRLSELVLSRNSLSGSIPKELSRLANLQGLTLEGNALTGTVPRELQSLRVNGSLRTLALANTSLTGTIPEGLCSLGVFDSGMKMGMSFDCNDDLCGCCWCPCPGSNYGAGEECETRPFVPSRDDKDWPGAFPTTVNTLNEITVNARTNSVPFIYDYEWSVLLFTEGEEKDSGSTGAASEWELVDFVYWTEEDADLLHSYTYQVESDTLYRLRLSEKYGYGIPMCCTHGFGWLTITDSFYPPGDHHPEGGEVIWEATGDALMYSLDVFIWVDRNGHSQPVEYVPGVGYVLGQEESSSDSVAVVILDGFVNNSSVAETKNYTSSIET